MSLTIAPSPFGSLVVSVAETGSTLSVSTVATSPCVLSMALGVPGPTGATGAQGPAGTNGTNGVGVPTGGSAGQVLAKIDGTNYNTQWVNAATGNFLPLTGGSMSGDIIWPPDGNGIDSQIGSFGFGVENTSGQTAYIEPQEVRVYDTTNTTGTRLIASGVQFNDGSTQVTSGLPLTGGTMTGDLDLSFAGINITYSQENSGIKSIYFTDTDDNVGDTILQSNLIIRSGIIQQSYNDVDYNFNLTRYGISGTDENLTSWGVGVNGVTFPNGTTQTTAFPPAGGTTSQYIDGTGALQTFPTVTSVGKILTAVRNNSGATMTKGTVVYINGAVGNKPTVAKAQANSEATSKATYGFVEANIANNSDGNIVILGLLENIDTQGFADGDLVYLSPTTAGGWTSTQPFSPYHYVRLGTVIRGGHPTLGSIAVQVTNGFQLDEMSDVGATAPTNNNVLTWVSASSQWLDRSITTILGYTPANVANYAYATNLQAVQNTSSTTVLSPANSRFAGISTNIWSPGVTGLTAATSGTGANSGSTVTSLSGALIAPNASTAGYATRGFNLLFPSNSVNSGYNYGTESGHSVKVYSTAWASTVAGVKMRAVFGRMSAGLPVPGTLASRGYGWEWDYSTKVISIIAHNGTSLTTTAQTWTPASNRNYDIAVYSNGAGTISLYIDGSLIGTGTGGPTTTSTTGQVWWQMEIENLVTAGSQQTIFYNNPKLITTNG